MAEQVDTKLVRRFRRAALILALVAILFGISVFIGYIAESYNSEIASFFNVAPKTVSSWTHNLKAVFPQLPVAMNPGTAAGFILSGLAVLCFRREPRPRVLLALGIACASVVLLIGLVKLGGIITSQNVYFDRILFKPQLEAEGLITGRPNQIAPNTALNFFLIGLALLFAFSRRFRIAHTFASATFFIALLAVLGYLYGVAKLIGVASYIPMALNTALAFEMISLAILFSFPDKGFLSIASSSTTGGIIMRRLVPAAIIVPALLGYLSLAGVRLGYFPDKLGAALLVVGNIVLFVVLIWRQSIVLYKVDEKRKIADAKLVEFISLASHQLKTPPGGIRWNAENLLDPSFGPLNPEQKDAVTIIHETSLKMIETVGALLNVSRLDLGTFIVDPKPTDYRELARAAIGELKPQIEAKQIRLEEKYDARIPLIPADHGLAKIVVENLISNAVKYTPEKGSVRVELALEESKKSILITVADTGYGIPKDQQGRIFEKMFRADNIKDKMDGTGFGLYLLKSIVELAEGEVWFDSVEGKGTTFFVRLPLIGMQSRGGTSHLTNVG